jgi:two-component system chemotaxis response regulator CheB
VSVVAKPKVGVRQFLQDESESLVAAIRAAAGARLRRQGAPLPRPKLTLDDLPAGPRLTVNADLTRVVAIGTSTGGTQALEVVLTHLPEAVPGIVVVQHMPAGFTDMFARRLDGLSRIRVREARPGDRVEPGLALIAPGGRHLQLARDGRRLPRGSGGRAPRSIATSRRWMCCSARWPERPGPRPGHHHDRHGRRRGPRV